MKLYFTAILFFVTTPWTLFAQSEVIFSNESITGFGGHGGPSIYITGIAGSPAIFMGGGGGSTIHLRSGNAFFLGGGGYGLVSELSRDLDVEGKQYLSLGYGGLELGYLHKYKRAYNITFRTHIGGGSAIEGSRRSGRDIREETGFLVIKPTLSLQINLTPTARIQFGAGYRWITGTELSGYSDQELSGVYGSVAMRFGFWP